LFRRNFRIMEIGKSMPAFGGGKLFCVRKHEVEQNDCGPRLIAARSGAGSVFR
jgi:hypothetical protein